jgi:serine-type D-Ala-D-Ala carboxypeptidase/endopeptidase (penicillin-binding protein 4)
MLFFGGLISCSAIKITSVSVQPPIEVKHDTVSQINAQIDRILDDTLLSPAFIGIKVVSLVNNKILYEKNSGKLFHPASNMKLLTTAVALSVLNEDFRFTTQVYTDGKIKDSILQGNLCVKGSGDPLLTTDDLDSLAKIIHELGIKKINGDLSGDVTLFDDEYWGSGWMWDDEPNPEEAFITPLTVNGNSVSVSVIPARSSGKRVTVELEPQTDFIELLNKCITSTDTLIPPLTVVRQKHENVIIIQGRISPKAPLQTFSFSVWKPELYFLHLLRDKLLGYGIELGGTIRLNTARENMRLASISHPLDSVIIRINKVSYNLAAENLLKTIAVVKRGFPGSAVNGLCVIKEYLSSIGIDTSSMILADGSGASFYNGISPDAIVKLLQKQYENKATFQRFIESLPIAGIDGTLKNRMKRSRAEGRVFAKTGTLSGSSCLSGYVRTRNENLLAFSIMCNHFPGDRAVLRNVQDKILELLADWSIEKQQ